MLKLSLYIIATALLCISYPEITSGSKILSVSFVSSKSHKITYERLLYELAARGHEVTIVSPIVSSKKPTKNIRQILTVDAEAFQEQYFKDNEQLDFYEMIEKGEQLNPFSMLKMLGAVCNVSYSLPHVQELLKEKFDLVIMSAIFNECVSGYVHKLNTSLILVSPASAPAWITSVLGGPSPPSFVPSLFLGYGDKMTFVQRTINLLATVGLTIMQDYSFKPAMEKIYREKLNDPTIPSSDTVIANASLVLANSHFSLSSPRPFLPDVIEVGGMHCEPAKPLPKVSSVTLYLL